MAWIRKVKRQGNTQPRPQIRNAFFFHRRGSSQGHSKAAVFCRQ
jgi:hypothetical protein